MASRQPPDKGRKRPTFEEFLERAGDPGTTVLAVNPSVIRQCRRRKKKAQGALMPVFPGRITRIANDVVYLFISLPNGKRYGASSVERLKELGFQDPREGDALRITLSEDGQMTIERMPDDMKLWEEVCLKTEEAFREGNA